MAFEPHQNKSSATKMGRFAAHGNSAEARQTAGFRVPF
jgi:hypothetical protein